LHRWGGNRRRREWDAADRGDTVRRLHRPGHEPDHRRSGAVLLPHRRRLQPADGDPGALGRGVHGALYHSQSIEATFSHIPGLKVVAPGRPADARGRLKSAVRDPDPVLYLEHKRTYRLIRGEVPDGDGLVPIGKADVKREGKDLSLIAYGLMLQYCLEAAEKLAQDGVSA